MNNININGVICLENNKKRLYIIVVGILIVIILIIVLAVLFQEKDENKGIGIKVSTGENLQISVDGLNWYSEINREMLTDITNYKTAVNQLPSILGSVSTAGYVNNGKLDMFYREISNEKDNVSLTAAKEDEESCLNDNECDNKHFIAFDIFLMTKEPISVGLSNKSKVSHIEKTKDFGLQNAARVGFVLQGTVASDKYLDAQALKGGFNSYIWEPNADTHKKNAISYAKEKFDIDIKTDGETPISYKGISTAFSDKVSILDTNNNLNFTDVNHVITTSQKNEETKVLFDVPSGISKIRIYLWVEGQDIDMLNKTEVNNLEYNLDFVVID